VRHRWMGAGEGQPTPGTEAALLAAFGGALRGAGGGLEGPRPGVAPARLRAATAGAVRPWEVVRCTGQGRRSLPHPGGVPRRKGEGLGRRVEVAAEIFGFGHGGHHLELDFFWEKQEGMRATGRGARAEGIGSSFYRQRGGSRVHEKALEGSGHLELDNHKNQR
jgi:hypothetical protein